MQKMTHRLTEELRRLVHENHDICTTCGYEFKEGDTSHLGYDKEDEPRYLCDSCSSELKEIAVRHYFTPHPYETPDNESRLWRYMDFTKYVSMLSTSSLYFARADVFDDIFEGAKGVITNKQMWDEHYLSFFRQTMKSPPDGVEWNLSKEHIEKEAQRLLNEMNSNGAYMREQVYISCWHENEHESEAMWRLYSSYLDNAIAIRTTYSSLYNSLGRDPSISIGRVKYIDFNKSYAGPNESFWRKRKSFEHEREVRAMLYDFQSEGIGKSLNCDLPSLIEEVVVSPTAPHWFVDVMNDINDKFNINIIVKQSKLNDVPFY